MQDASSKQQTKQKYKLNHQQTGVPPHSALPIRGKTSVKKIEIVSSIFSEPQCYKTRYQLREKKSVRNTNTWRLHNTFLNNQQVTEEIKREIKKFLETNDNKNTTTQNLWDAAKAVLRGTLIAVQSYLKKQEKHRKDSLPLHLNQLRKEKKKKTNVSIRKEIIKIRAEINEK